MVLKTSSLQNAVNKGLKYLFLVWIKQRSLNLGDSNAEVPVNRTGRFTKYAKQVLGEPLKNKYIHKTDSNRKLAVS